MGVREVLNLADFTEDPSFFVVATVDEAVYFGIFKGEELVGGVMVGDELLEVDVEFKGVNGVTVSEFEFL